MRAENGNYVAKFPVAKCFSFRIELPTSRHGSMDQSCDVVLAMACLSTCTMLTAAFGLSKKSLWSHGTFRIDQNKQFM